MRAYPWLLAVGLVMWRAGTASADKPTPPDAKQTAADWLDGLGAGESQDKLEAALPLTAVPLFAVAFNDGLHDCDAATARTAEEVRKALACLRKVITRAELEPWTKKAAKELPPPLRQYRSRLAALDRTATLVHHHEPCAGVGSDVIVAVALDKGKDKQAPATPKVVAVFSQNVFCGE